ncbi:DUF5134 domain-containing protein [Streptomyces sp. NBC_01187]|uniref:DUF5134 domain-containing protein n=1 Tax=Streptomyces sp. NBC_01187 TaxID=2903766 RepID=UPI00387039F5|nr:DUF5134 domain-containing protein [Streptomyces sp. NBC_01187]
MHGPATIGWLLVALCAITGVSCALRAREAADRQPRADAVSEALMGFGMALMAVPALWSAEPLSPTLLAWLFAAAFGALAARELWSLGGRRGAGPGERGPAHLHHVVGALAMVYMSLAMATGASPGTSQGPAPPHHAGAGGIPLLTGALLAYFAVYVLWGGARVMPSGTAAGAQWAGAAAATGTGTGTGARGACPGGVAHRAGVATGCRVAMGAGMFAMLLTL